MKFLIGKVGPTAWNIWSNLFDEKIGAHALLMMGYATPSNFTNMELLQPVIHWMSFKPGRSLSIFVGLETEGNDKRLRKQKEDIVEVFASVLARLTSDSRRNVNIHLVPNLHAKIYAIYDCHPLNATIFEGKCLRLMLGSSNLFYTAFSKNFEFDVYFEAPKDDTSLNDAALALKKMMLTMYFGWNSHGPAPIKPFEFESSDMMFGDLWGIDMDFYNQIVSRMSSIEDKNNAAQKLAINREHQQASDDALKEQDLN